MAKLYVPTRSIEDWRLLLADPDRQWRPGFSAFSTAASWEGAQGLPNEINALFGGNAELLLAIPEHKVRLPGGGRESQCDIFALLRLEAHTCAMAVEAKVNETFGPTIGEWRRGESPGKIRRLSAICQLLGLNYPPPDDLRYQLFHRTAAAIYEAERFRAGCAAMVVQSFSQDHRWYDDFAAFCQLLGVPSSRDTLFETFSPGGVRLLLGWVTSDKVTA